MKRQSRSSTLRRKSLNRYLGLIERMAKEQGRLTKIIDSATKNLTSLETTVTEKTTLLDNTMKDRTEALQTSLSERIKGLGVDGRTRGHRSRQDDELSAPML